VLPELPELPVTTPLPDLPDTSAGTPAAGSTPHGNVAAGLADGSSAAAASSDQADASTGVISATTDVVVTDPASALRDRIAQQASGSADGASVAVGTSIPVAPLPADDRSPLGDDGLPGLPSGASGSAGSGSAGAGSGSAGAVVGDAARPSALPGLAVSAGSADGDDDLPSTPTYDTDSSPD
jgi:hypothetical protein